MNMINNVLFIEDFCLDDFKQFNQGVTDLLKKHFGDSTNILNTKNEIVELVKKITLVRATELINTEYEQQHGRGTSIIIEFQSNIGTYTTRLSDKGLHDGGWDIAGIVIAINKAHCNIKRAQKMAKYLKALGFGLHRELSGEED